MSDMFPHTSKSRFSSFSEESEPIFGKEKKILNLFGLVKTLDFQLFFTSFRQSNVIVSTCVDQTQGTSLTNTRHSTKGTGPPHSKHDCATGNNDTRGQCWWIDVSLKSNHLCSKLINDMFDVELLIMFLMFPSCSLRKHR